ncbi:hypothetical protein RRF57_012677 [Xylaria bambusicola]|uniref:Uncharacterized protein n=1 Tax=Xylaria bambusicola TaxID=326684 RepID=A0AAN7Z4Q4_9PEZI
MQTLHYALPGFEPSFTVLAKRTRVVLLQSYPPGQSGNSLPSLAESIQGSGIGHRSVIRGADVEPERKCPSSPQPPSRLLTRSQGAYLFLSASPVGYSTGRI